MENNKYVKAQEREWKKDSISDNGIKDLLKNTQGYADYQHDWYEDKIETKRILSQIIRVLVILSFSCSAFLMIEMAYTEDSDEILVLSLNYGSLILASILLLIDKVFGFSESWMRFSQSQIEIGKIVSEYHNQWITTFLEKNLEESEIKKLQLEVLQNFDKALRKVINDETIGWSTNLRNQLKLLSNKIDAELKTSQTKFESKKKEIEKKRTIEEENKKSAHLIVTVNFKDFTKGEFTLGKKDKYIFKKNQKTTVFRNQEKDNYPWKATFHIKGEDHYFENVKEIKAGINEITIP